jgi:peptide/nickel transport system permease protein
MSQDEYYRGILDRISDAFIGLFVYLISTIRKGWREKNRSRIAEWKLMFYALNRSPPGVIGLFLVTIFVFLGIFGPLIAPYKYNYFPIFENSKTYLSPPGEFFVLGADHFGRDLLSLLLQGARTSLVISIIVILLGVPAGIILGLIAGYFGGKIDELIMRITDMFLAFPPLILAIAFAAVLPDRISYLINTYPPLQQFLLWLFALERTEGGNLSRLLAVMIAMAVVWWPGYARITRGSTLTEREALYVESARAIGLPSSKIMLRHILPNIIGPILVYVTLDFGTVVLTEAGLSFLGLGATPPIADWGRIVYDGTQFFPNAWWLIIFPGFIVFLDVLGWNLLGDALRDVLDPKLRRSIEFKVKKVRKSKTKDMEIKEVEHE